MYCQWKVRCHQSSMAYALDLHWIQTHFMQNNDHEIGSIRTKSKFTTLTSIHNEDDRFSKVNDLSLAGCVDVVLSTENQQQRHFLPQHFWLKSLNIVNYLQIFFMYWTWIWIEHNKNIMKKNSSFLNWFHYWFLQYFLR